jgi:hypothetical protein
VKIPFHEVVARVSARLAERGVPARVIGAGALAVHGVSRATRVLDLLVVDAAILRPAWWADLDLPGFVIDVRRGDVDDPLLGVVRIEAEDDDEDPGEQLDLVVTPGAWSRAILERPATDLRTGESPLPVVSPADRILLKLYAGGPGDGWDIDALLAVAPHRDALVREVAGGVDALPPRCARMWTRLTTAAES